MSSRLRDFELDKLKSLERAITYEFNNTALLKQALTHRSYAHENGTLSNERLEFLGDAVLELIIRKFLFDRFPDAEEGILSRLKTEVVKEKTLASVARSISLGKYLFLGKNELKNGVNKKNSVLADALEALIGAIYLDGGFEAAKRAVFVLFGVLLNGLNPGFCSDYKSLLQNYTQTRLYLLPEYRVLKTDGPHHDRTFVVGVYLNGELLATGQGKNRKTAEQMAAREAINKLREKAYGRERAKKAF